MISVPVAPPVLAVLGIREIGREVGHRMSGNLKIAKHHHLNGTDTAEVGMLMAQDSMLVDPTGLIMLSIIRQRAKNLKRNVSPLLAGVKKMKCVQAPLHHPREEFQS